MNAWIRHSGVTGVNATSRLEGTKRGWDVGRGVPLRLPTDLLFCDFVKWHILVKFDVLNLKYIITFGDIPIIRGCVSGIPGGVDASDSPLPGNA